MDTSNTWIDLYDQYDTQIAVNVSWSTTVYNNDTVTLTTINALRPAMGIEIEALAISMNEGYIRFNDYFITRPSTADATPPTVQTVYPYNGVTGVPVGTEIYCIFSEIMNPLTINNTNITLSGPGITGPSDYTVIYEGEAFEDGAAIVKKNGPFSEGQTYTVTITTNVRDLRGNPLKEGYQWSFTAGTDDETAPTVTQTIPIDGDTKVSQSPMMHAVFSERMDETTINSSNIFLWDNTDMIPVDIFIDDFADDYVSFGLPYPSGLQTGHEYIVTISTGVKDKAGNSLSVPFSWSFTVGGAEEDKDPRIQWGMDGCDNRGERWSDGSTRLSLELGAWDDYTNSLTVTATSPPSYNWSLTGDNYGYSYESSGDEGLGAGTHTLTYVIQDGASNQVTFQRDIYIFSSWPVLSSPANGATGVSVTPTFEWTYSGTDRPFYHAVVVGTDPDIANHVWHSYVLDRGDDTYSLSIPVDRQLSPNTEYYWAVMIGTETDNGEAYSDVRSFTTGGTPPPLPKLQWVVVRSDDRPPPTGLKWGLGASVAGPSPADIVELKVTGPGGFQYIFTEDDILQGEQNGIYFWHSIQSTLVNGLYIFTVTDSMGRTATANFNFSNPTSTIPRVNSLSMLPVDSSYGNTRTPTFSWASVGSGYYYRIMVMDWNFKEDAVYTSGFTQGTQITVPSGYLLPNTPYRWRVEAFDAPGGIDGPAARNRSVSETLRFSTGSNPYGLDLAWGFVWGDNSYYSGFTTSYCAGVIGPLPNEVTQMNVSGPSGFNYNFTEDNIQYDLVTEGVQYCYGEVGFAENGTYDFYVEDTDGASDSYQKVRTSTEAIPIVEQSSLVPANNAYLNTLTPTFTWTAVGGSNRYYRVKIGDWMGRYTVYSSPRSTDLYAAIPSEILKSNQSYKWRVEVFDDPDGLVTNNRSSSAWNSFTTTAPCSGAVTLISPSGMVTTSTPTYTWIADTSATWYQLVVTDPTGNKVQQWYKAGDVCSADTCSVTPTRALAIGAAEWKVQTYGNCGYGPWSSLMSFAVTCMDAAATPISPSGTITTSTPVYTWGAVSGAMWYQLLVTDTTGTKILQWYPASAAGCASGTGNCSVTPTTALAVGAAEWKVQTYGNCGFGPWSALMSFTVTCMDAAATPISPSGTTTDITKPTYTWQAVSGAMWYQLLVTDSTGIKILQWYSASAAGCASGTGNCSVTPATALAVGAAEWKIQTYGNCGFGPWSDPMSFTVTCLDVAATPISPSGTITTLTPTYTWGAVSGATWYQLLVTDSIGIEILQWYSASAAGCASGTGNCSVTPTTALTTGATEWKVQTYGNCGFGPWSDPMPFTVTCLEAPILLSPSGTTTSSTPTYTWGAVSGATWYQLVVTDSTGTKILQWYTSSAAGCASGTGNCSVTPTTALAAGTAEWKVETYGNCGFGPWSDPMSFTVPCMDVADKATPISPSGTITTFTPTYTWGAVSGATWYQLLVTDSTGTKILQWYPASAAGCASGMGNCSMTPATALAAGAAEWKVETYGNCVGFGAWSDPMSFTMPCMDVADKATPISPSGTITTSKPTYTWGAVSGATWYQLLVTDSTGAKILQWYSASVCGCASGMGNCSVTPTTALAAGAAEWKVETYANCVGFGALSDPMSFTVGP
jgi:hypothetical protein